MKWIICLLFHLATALPQQIPLSSSSSVLDLKWPTDPKHLAALHEHINSWSELRTIRFVQDGQITERQLPEGAKALLVFNKIRFSDVTDDVDHLQAQSVDLPKVLTFHKDAILPLYKNISESRMKDRLTHFTSFRTRYYRSQTGKDSQQWLLSQIKDIIAPAKHISVQEFAHSWGQNSIIIHFDAEHQSVNKDVSVVIGAHQDSTNLLPFLSAPGADDDGSGSMTVLETLNVLVQNNFRPKNSSLELHWYSAEEGGLLGSNAVAQSYAQQGRKIKAMLQMDMTAYIKPGTAERIGLIQDFVDPQLTALLGDIVEEYATIPQIKTKCGYACSDHASWSKIGVPSAFAIEASFEDSNKNIHSSRDTIDVEGFSFSHMAQFVRMATAFGVELTS